MQANEIISLMSLYNDETALELYQALLKAALKYTTFRFQWELYTQEEREQNDKYRTSAHNAYMDCLNIFLRYAKTISDNVPVIPEHWTRKELGDLACQLVCEVAIRNR
mgnify:CR=1 FL=1